MVCFNVCTLVHTNHQTARNHNETVKDQVAYFKFLVSILDSWPSFAYLGWGVVGYIVTLYSTPGAPPNMLVNDATTNGMTVSYYNNVAPYATNHIILFDTHRSFGVYSPTTV